MSNSETWAKYTSVWAWNYKCSKRIVVNQGGTSSGKTYAILQTLLRRGAENPDSVISVVGQDFPNLRKGAIRDLETIIKKEPFSTWCLKPNKSSFTYPLFNGSLIEFVSFKDEQDAKSGKRDYSFFNEADGIPYPVYRQVAMRTKKQVFIDFNPSSEFWAHTHLQGRSDTQFFYSTYRENSECPVEIIDEIERLKFIDPELYKVYALGRRGNLTGQIFPNVEVVEEFPANAKWVTYGLDFGFNSPAALVKIGFFNQGIYLKELIYEKGLTNKELSNRMKELKVRRNIPIIADSAEPKSIKDLKKLGWKVYPAVKGQDSVKAGIWKMKEYPLFITMDSINFKKEKKNYIWKTDKDGESTNTPVDAFNHCWDASRYAVMDRLSGQKLPPIL